MDDNKELIAALGKFQAEVGIVFKVDKSMYAKYADLATIMKAIQPVLTACGLVVVQQPSFGEGGHFLTTTIFHISGQSMSTTMRLAFATRTKEAYVEFTPGMQEIGGALTYARRYMLSAMLNIVTDLDDDGESAGGSQGSKKTTISKKKTLSMDEILATEGEKYDAFSAEHKAKLQQVYKSATGLLVLKGDTLDKLVDISVKASGRIPLVCLVDYVQNTLMEGK